MQASITDTSRSAQGLDGRSSRVHTSGGGRRSGSRSGNRLLDIGMVGRHTIEAVDVEETGLEEGGDEAGEAVMCVSSCPSHFKHFCPRILHKCIVGYLQGQERERLERLLQRAPAPRERRRVGAAVVVVVLDGEDEGCEPEEGEDPGKGREVAFVGFHHGEKHGGEVDEGVNRRLIWNMVST
jgi:hypothetical protein